MGQCKNVNSIYNKKKMKNEKLHNYLDIQVRVIIITQIILLYQLLFFPHCK